MQAGGTNAIYMGETRKLVFERGGVHLLDMRSKTIKIHMREHLSEYHLDLTASEKEAASDSGAGNDGNANLGEERDLPELSASNYAVLVQEMHVDLADLQASCQRQVNFLLPLPFASCNVSLNK